MEVKKDANEVVKNMMNLIKQLFQESMKGKLDEAPFTKDQVPIDEEMLEEQACE